MTEQEWLEAKDESQWMVACLSEHGLPRTKVGRRKLRLFACGCCRITWDILPEARLRDAIEIAERFADEQASKDELAAVKSDISPLRFDGDLFGRAQREIRVAIDMVVATTHPRPFESAFMMTAMRAPLGGKLPKKAAQAYICDLLRCVFGNPFRPIVIKQSWRSTTAVDLAHMIYEDRAFERMPILADALEDAGCDVAEILDHCRGPGPHTRGCWVIDQLLGKKSPPRVPPG